MTTRRRRPSHPSLFRNAIPVTYLKITEREGRRKGERERDRERERERERQTDRERGEMEGVDTVYSDSILSND